ncbi:outer membrane protein assembly factor BamB family protein [Cellulosimicrobium sp. 22601]|uniref:outer membrane protein assembly factor BamB family protein n=1 Tax=unclassified Cellulosimicrobium TaxID=2624466 RepID=UPI003F8541A8
MPLRRRDARDRLTFELVESADADADLEDDAPAWGSATGPGQAPRGGAAGATWPGAVRSGVARPVDLDAAALGPDARDQDAEDAPDGEEPRPAGDGPDGPRAPRRGRRPAMVGAVAAGVALVLGGMLAVDAWHGRAGLDRLRAAPGGVEPLPDAPREQWTADVGLTGGLALLPDSMVTVEDGEAVAVSLDSGEERWRVDVGKDATCGSWLYWLSPSGEPDDTLVCVAPVPEPSGGIVRDGPREVDPMTGRVVATTWTITVVDDDGEVLGQRDASTDGALLTPGPDGSIVRAERVGEVPAGEGAVVEVDDLTGMPNEIPEGRPAVVQVEDALTGDLRWEAELPFVAGSGQCTVWSEADGDETVRADLENLWTAVETRLVRVEGCGVTSWFTHDGTRLDEPDNPVDGVVALVDGTYSRDPTGNDYGWGPSSGTEPTSAPAILGADGSVRWEPPGSVLSPPSTDGRPVPTFVRDGLDLVAFDAEGTELWRTSEQSTPDAVLVAAGGTLVVAHGYGDGALAGVDLTTGGERWSLDREELIAGLEIGAGWSAEVAYTDGSRAILAVSDWEAGTTSLIALDLADGGVAWTAQTTGHDGGSWVAPLQGRLLRMSETEITRLG